MAAKLTGWRIDIKSLAEAAADALHKRQQPEAEEELDERDKEIMAQVEHILAKKAEGRAIPPEEYQILTRFVVGAEKMALEQREADKMAKRERLDAIRTAIPKAAFETPLDELNIPIRYSILLGGEGFSTIGDLMYQISLDSDVILGLNGMGPKALSEILTALDEYRASLPVEEKAEAEAPTAPPADASTPVEEVAIETGTEETSPAQLLETPAEAEPEVIEETAPSVEESVSEQPEVSSLSVEEVPTQTTAEEPIEELDNVNNLVEMVDIKENVEEEDEEESDSDKGKKKKKGKKRNTEIEYDPDRDVMVVKKKHKKGGKEVWMEDWD